MSDRDRIFSEALDVLHHCVLGIDALDRLDDLRQAKVEELERRLDGQAAALRALAMTAPGEVAEAMTRHMLRSVDGDE